MISGITRYCCWRKSGVCQLRLVVNATICRVFYIPGDAGFLPSTVVTVGKVHVCIVSRVSTNYLIMILIIYCTLLPFCISPINFVKVNQSFGNLCKPISLLSTRKNHHRSPFTVRSAIGKIFPVDSSRSPNLPDSISPDRCFGWTTCLQYDWIFWPGISKSMDEGPLKEKNIDPPKKFKERFPFQVTKNGICFLRFLFFCLGSLPWTFSNFSLPWWKNHFKWLRRNHDCGWSFISPFQRVNNNWPPGLFWATFETSVRG